MEGDSVPLLLHGFAYPADPSLGGLVGYHFGLINTSWAGGEVTGGTAVGGLVGHSEVGDGIWIPYFDTQVADCYATGAVRGDNIVGGLVGSNDGNAAAMLFHRRGDNLTGVDAGLDPRSSVGRAGGER